MSPHYLPPSKTNGKDTFNQGKYILPLLSDATNGNTVCNSVSLINLGAEFVSSELPAFCYGLRASV